MKTTSAAVPSLVFGVSDLGMSRKLTFQEQQLFERYFDRLPLEVELSDRILRGSDKWNERLKACARASGEYDRLHAKWFEPYGGSAVR